MSDASEVKRPWWTHMNGYHWYVFALAAMGWLFDTMDQMIFTASRSKAMADLLPGVAVEIQRQYGSWITTVFIIGWATGGLIFGMVGDRWGRAKTMALTIFIYASFTGLSGLAQNWWQFGACRFLTGLGVGGEFAAGAALVAEVMPEKSRAHALGTLQALSAIGNIIGAALLGIVGPTEWGWRGLYYIGAFPALLAVFVRAGLKEPEKWVAAKARAASDVAAGKAVKFGRMSELFSPQWRRNTLVGLSLAIAGVIGVWGVGFYSPELFDSTFPRIADDVKGRLVTTVESTADGASPLASLNADDKKVMTLLLAKALKPGEKLDVEHPEATVLNADRKAKLHAMFDATLSPKAHDKLKSEALMLQQVGAFISMFLFSIISARIGRRLTFFFAFVLAWISIAVTFLGLKSTDQIWYLYPFLGLGTLAPFGGYAIYFPELFPTRLRTTGTGLCYNVGRYVSALGPPMLAYFASLLDGRFETQGFRVAAIIVASSYVIGMVALIWAPETVDQPLPEDERMLAH